MPLRAVGLRSLALGKCKPGYPPLYVLLVGNKLQVPRIHTVSYSAEVIEFEARQDFAH